MDMIWFFPLAPTIVFLVGAFVVAIAPRKNYTSLIISLFILGMLLSRVAFRRIDSFSSPPQILSGWGVGGALTMRVDGLSMAFLFMPVLLLIALFWARQASDHSLLLILAGAASPVFVAANGLSFSYALVFFDVIGCLYWLKFQRPNLALARLFLAVLTTSVLILTGLADTAGLGGTLLAFALWLRVALLPFVEISYLGEEQLSTGKMMIWLALSTAVGVYVAARFLAVPLPLFVMGLTVLMMVLNAWLAWLLDPKNMRPKLLSMILTQPSLALLIAPISDQLSITLGLVYTLGLGTLWLTPQIGRPNFLERHWPWIYAAPILATLSLIGFPATFGWLAADRVYTALLLANQLGVVAAVVLAEGIAFSVFYQYWAWLLHEPAEKGAALHAALILAVPFLIPWVGGVTFSVVTGLDLSQTGGGATIARSTWIIVPLIWLLALGFGHSRRTILGWLKITPQAIKPLLDLTWLWPYAGQGIDQLSRWVLRLRSILEGVHYLGWAFLIGLAGVLVVILS